MVAEKRVVLFGRTGAGKSTVANALVTGGIDQPMLFPASDAPTGCTSEIVGKSGRGWTVIDTIGLGEAESGTMSHEAAQLKLAGFLNDVRFSYSHIIFVQKADRVTELDKVIWTLFADIFKGAEEAFVILFTDATEKWLEENMDKLPDYMASYDKFVVNIPPISNGRVRENRNQATRVRSLHDLEEKLVAHFAKRGNQPSVPNIVRMDEKELKEKSESLMDIAIQIIKECIDPVNWFRFASKIASWINVMDALQTMADNF